MNLRNILGGIVILLLALVVVAVMVAGFTEFVNLLIRNKW